MYWRGSRVFPAQTAEPQQSEQKSALAALGITSANNYRVLQGVGDGRHREDGLDCFIASFVQKCGTHTIYTNKYLFKMFVHTFLVL